MPSPWLFALKMIPWASLLSNAPAIAGAADALLSGTKARTGREDHTAEVVDEIRSLRERVAALESHDRADAELGKQISDQIAALTRVTEVLAVRQRWLLALAATALLGLVAVLLLRL